MNQASTMNQTSSISPAFTMYQALTVNQAPTFISFLVRSFKMGNYGDFDFNVMAVGEELRSALLYVRFLVLPFPGKFLLYFIKIDLFFLKKDEIRTFGNVEVVVDFRRMAGIFSRCRQAELIFILRLIFRNEEALDRKVKMEILAFS